MSAGSRQGPGSGGTPFRPPVAASTPAPPIVSCVLAARELVSDGPLPLPESGGGHVLRSQSLPALPDGRRSLLRQPVGRMCGSPRPVACAVGGCARAVRWERLPRVPEADKAAGWRRASKKCLPAGSPAASAGSTGQKKAGFSGRSPVFPEALPAFAGKSWPENGIRRPCEGVVKGETAIVFRKRLSVNHLRK